MQESVAIAHYNIDRNNDNFRRFHKRRLAGIHFLPSKSGFRFSRFCMFARRVHLRFYRMKFWDLENTLFFVLDAR